MDNFNIEALWKKRKQPAKASAADLLREQSEWNAQRDSLLKEHEKLNASKVAAAESRGPAALKEIQTKMRDLEDQIDTCDVMLGPYPERIKEATDRETDEKLKAESEKVWKPLAKREFELRDQALKKGIELHDILKEYREIRSKATWRTVIGRADALGLKPVDEFNQLLATKGNQRPHPVNDEVLFGRLKEVNGFNDHLKDLGIEV